MSDELPLTGGNVTSGAVRVGDTVRRPAGPHSPDMRALLQHLETAGFSAAPRFLGIDEQGRDTLQWLDGDTAFPPDMWTDDKALVAAARLLRGFHDATAGSALAAGAEVVCHNDFAPYNMVFRDGAPVAVIDFDLAAPGRRLWDLAYLAWWMAPLGSGDDMAAAAQADLAAGCRRLRLLARTYGLPADAALLDTVAQVLAHMGSRAAMVKSIGEAATRRLEAGGHLAFWRAQAARFATVRTDIGANLAK